MFGGTLDGAFSAVATLAAVFSVGLAIKLMDDFIDRRMDGVAGVTTWAGRLGDGSLPYCMAALTVALLIDAPVAGTLFLAAYAVGMTHDLTRRLPLGLLGWQESAVALVVGTLLGGPLPMLAALAAVVFVQCADDLVDAEGDRRRGHRSLVVMLGPVETALLGLAALIVACSLTPLVTTAVVIGTAGVEWFVDQLSPSNRRNVHLEAHLGTVPGVRGRRER